MTSDDSREEPSPRGNRARAGRAWVILGVGVLAYVLTVMQRTTLGVVGLDAADRFSLSPGTLSGFVFVQVAVYVVAQLPAGLLVDRWGARVMLVVSGALLALGQAILAVATTLPLAVAARVLVGVGDAIVFVGVLALIPRWFEASRVPLLTQMTTILGQLGQILSAVPFVALVGAVGWATGFGTAAALSALAAVLVAAVVRNAPGQTWTRGRSTSLRSVGTELRAVWARPGTRVGFFGHMGTQFSMMVFALLWGVPYLVSAQGLSSAAAGGLMSLFVVSSILIAPVLGLLTTRHPLRRPWLLLVAIALKALVWTVVLALPGPTPGWLLVVLIVVLATGGPASVVAIDLGRTANPSSSLGVAQSMVNLGGFLATLLVLATMGAIMTAMGGFTPDAFRVAWLVQYPVWTVAVVGVLVSRRQARRHDAARDVAPLRAGPPDGGRSGGEDIDPSGVPERRPLADARVGH